MDEKQDNDNPERQSPLPAIGMGGGQGGEVGLSEAKISPVQGLSDGSHPSAEDAQASAVFDPHPLQGGSSKGEGAEQATFDALLVEARALPAHDYQGASDVIGRAAQGGFRPGELAYLIQVLNEFTGVAVSVLNQVLRDARNTDRREFVLHDAASIVEAVKKDLSTQFVSFVWCAGVLWHYQADDGQGGGGYFGSSHRDDVERHLLEEYRGFPALARKGQRDEVIGQLTSELSNPSFFNDAASGLNMLNGFLRFDVDRCSVELLPTEPEHKARSRLLVDYDPQAEAPVFMAGLARTLPDAAVAALAEFIGCTLFGVTPPRDNARHVLLLVGQRNTGKSTLLELLRLLVPDYAICAVSPTVWGRDYDRASLSGKLLNIVSELGKEKVIQGSIFKALCSHEDVTARFPYGRPFRFKPTARHCFACNEPPRTDDVDPAFERRILAIRMGRSLEPGEMQPDFLQRAQAELSGIVRWAMEGAIRVMRRGYFLCPPGHREIVAEMQHGSDLFARFAIHRVEPAPETAPGVSTRELHAAVQQFAHQEGADTASWQPTTGARKLAGYLRMIHGATQFQRTGVPHYRGIRLKP